jgi:hypothetical protein
MEWWLFLLFSLLARYQERNAFLDAHRFLNGQKPHGVTQIH